MTLEDISKYLSKNAVEIRDLGRFGGWIVFWVFMGYLAASTVTTASLRFFSKGVLDTQIQAQRSSLTKDFSSDFNHREFKKIVVARNIFNSTGEVPSDAEDTSGSELGKKFDERADCSKSTLNIELLGTIYLGGNNSLATVKEKGYTEADVYRAGDTILGTQALLHKVERERIIINNLGTKECLEMELPKLFQTPEMRGLVPSTRPGIAAPAKSSGESSHITLSAAFVEQALGPGFAKILESGRLVPYHKDNQMIGFKLIGVKPDSLWKKATLSSGDVITAVNDISMSRPDQGFAVYQALQDSREIRIEILKGSQTPQTLTVEIK